MLIHDPSASNAECNNSTRNPGSAVIEEGGVAFPANKTAGQATIPNTTRVTLRNVTDKHPITGGSQIARDNINRGTDFCAEPTMLNMYHCINDTNRQEPQLPICQ